MIKKIELFEKQAIDDNSISLIAECNMYNDDLILINQFSRSLFVFPNTMTDEEIITSIQENEYSIYF